MMLRDVLIKIFIFLAGALIGLYLLPKLYHNQTAKVENKQVSTISVFNKVYATAQGKIIKVTPKLVSIKTDNDQIGDFSLSSRITIYDFKTGTNQPTESGSSSSIQTDKEAIFTFEMIGNRYQLTIISYLPPQQNIPLTPATPSAHPK